MVCLDNFVEFSILRHNRKIPIGLTETHEDDIPKRAMEGLTGGVK